MINFTLFLLTLSRLATGHSFKNVGIRVPFCSACFLSSPAAADWHCLACPPIQAATHRALAQLSFTVSVHKFTPFSFAISISSPRNDRRQAPKLLASVLRCSSWENDFIQTHGREEPAILHACCIRWPLFLEEYHTPCGSVRVSVWQRWEHKYPTLSLAVILWVPYPNTAKPQTCLSCQIPCDVAPGDMATNTAYPTHPCVANTQKGF